MGSVHWIACAHAILPSITGSLRTDEIQAAGRTKVASGVPSSEGGPGSECFGCIYDDARMERFCHSICLTPCELDTAAELAMGGQILADVAGLSGLVVSGMFEQVRDWASHRLRTSSRRLLPSCAPCV